MTSSPPTGTAQRRQAPRHGALTVPVAMMPPMNDSSTTSQVTSALVGHDAVGGRLADDDVVRVDRAPANLVPPGARRHAGAGRRGRRRGSRASPASSPSRTLPHRRPTGSAAAGPARSRVRPAGAGLRQVLVEEPVLGTVVVLPATGDRHGHLLGRRRGRLQLRPARLGRSARSARARSPSRPASGRSSPRPRGASAGPLRWRRRGCAGRPGWPGGRPRCARPCARPGPGRRPSAPRPRARARP